MNSAHKNVNFLKRTETHSGFTKNLNSAIYLLSSRHSQTGWLKHALPLFTIMRSTPFYIKV